VTQGVEQPEQEEHACGCSGCDGAGVAVASSRECVVALPRAWSRVVRGGRAGHTDDLPGLTVRVGSAILYILERLSLRLMAMSRAGAWKECLSP
jgi:hypothetical protein